MADLSHYNDEELRALYQMTPDTDPLRLDLFRRLNPTGEPASSPGKKLIFGYRGVNGFDIVTPRNAVIFAVLDIFITIWFLIDETAPVFGTAGFTAMMVLAIIPLLLLAVLPLLRLIPARPFSIIMRPEAKKSFKTRSMIFGVLPGTGAFPSRLRGHIRSGCVS